MTPETPLQRVPLRDRIYDVVRERILRGELAPRAVVRDHDLAENLGASRTPVREALIRLTSEGLLENRVGRGFRVRPLVRREIEEAYPVLGALELLALETSAPASKKQATQLERLTRHLEDRSAGAAQRNDVDVAWHRVLVSGCENERLHRYLEEVRGAVRRYETAYLAGIEGMERSVREHRSIATAFCAGDRAEAVRLLREHWHRGMGELLALLPEETAE